jgi:hypothetical protein
VWQTVGVSGVKRNAELAAENVLTCARREEQVLVIAGLSERIGRLPMMSGLAPRSDAAHALLPQEPSRQDGR